MELSIVLPCYNEGRSLLGILDRFARVQEDYDWELILVDNGSTDDTREVLALEAAREDRRFFSVVRVDVNQGYGFGILQGLAAARGRLLAWSHADQQTPLEDIFRAARKLRSVPNPDKAMVKGLRARRAWRAEALTLGMQWVTSTVLGLPLEDINAQPKVFPRTLYERFVNPPHDFNLDLYLYSLALRSGFEVHTVDVVFGQRPHGQSRWAYSLRSRLKHISATVRYSLHLRRRGV